MDQSWMIEHDTAFLQIISDISGLPCMLLTASYLWTSGENAEHPCRSDQELTGKLEKDCPPDHPGIYMENEFVFWGVMRLGNYLIGIGPALCNSPETGYGARYARKHGMKNDCPLKKTGFGEMAKLLSLLSCHFLGTAIPYDQVVPMGYGAEHAGWESEADLSHYQIMQSEYGRSHKTGENFEDKLAGAVRSGDVEAVQRLIGGRMPDIGETGKVADGERKQMEYMAVSMITILTRAAIEGGMRSETAHELGDIYLRRLSAASLRGGAFTTLTLKAMTEFAEGVARARQEKSGRSHVEACKAYIEANLLKDIQVGDIAPAIGLTRTYLAHLFRKEEGITIQQYISREKCRKAERLLKYTDYSIALIAEYYGFSSPGYFGTCFRQWFGMTPGQYRHVHARK